DHLLGADVEVIGRDDDTNQREAQRALAERLRQEGRRPYLAPEDDALGPLAYVNLMLELTEQLEERGIQPSRVYVCSGRVTQSGMIGGTRCLGDPFRIVGINPYPRRPNTLSGMAELANAAARRLGIETGFAAADVDNVDDYVGREYGIPTPASVEAIKLV